MGRAEFPNKTGEYPFSVITAGEIFDL